MRPPPPPPRSPQPSLPGAIIIFPSAPMAATPDRGVKNIIPPSKQVPKRRNRPATVAHRDIEQDIFLVFGRHTVYVLVLFLFGTRKCVSAKVPAVVAGERWFSRMRGGCRKNVYFCFGNFTSLIKALWGIHVYFCLPAWKAPSSEIKDLAEKMSTFVYFCIPFTFGRGVFRF
jgi:hypothetical protein